MKKAKIDKQLERAIDDFCGVSTASRIARCFQQCIKRLVAATKTNDAQFTSVCMLTAFNGLALASRTGHTPIWLTIGALAFWPLLAFIFNLLDPIQ